MVPKTKKQKFAAISSIMKKVESLMLSSRVNNKSNELSASQVFLPN